MNEFTIKARENEFRIKKMNAIELLAFQSQISFDSMDAAKNMYANILEMIEVKFKEQWLPVKEKGKDIYYPSGIEDDFESISEIIGYFLNDYLKPLFSKSDASKQ